MVQLAHEVRKIDLQRMQPRPQLDHVQAALPTLDLADGGLTPAKPDGQIRLTQALRFPAAPEHAQEDVVVTGVDRLDHGDLSRATLDRMPPYSESESMARRSARPCAFRLVFRPDSHRMNAL